MFSASGCREWWKCGYMGNLPRCPQCGQGTHWDEQNDFDRGAFDDQEPAMDHEFNSEKDEENFIESERVLIEHPEKR